MCIFGRSNSTPTTTPTPPSPVKRPDSSITASFRRRNRQQRGVLDNIYTSPLGVRTGDATAAPRLGGPAVAGA